MQPARTAYLQKLPISKPTKMSKKNITSERKSLRITALADKRPPVKKNSKKLAPESKRRVAKEELKRKQGEIKVKKSKKLKSAVEEKISEVEEVKKLISVFMFKKFTFLILVSKNVHCT